MTALVAAEVAPAGLFILLGPAWLWKPMASLPAGDITYTAQQTSASNPSLWKSALWLCESICCVKDARCVKHANLLVLGVLQTGIPAGNRRVQYTGSLTYQEMPGQAGHNVAAIDKPRCVSPHQQSALGGCQAQSP